MDRRRQLTVLDLVTSSYMTWIVFDSISIDLGTTGGFNYFDAVRFCYIIRITIPSIVSIVEPNRTCSIWFFFVGFGLPAFSLGLRPEA